MQPTLLNLAYCEYQNHLALARPLLNWFKAPALPLFYIPLEVGT